MKRNISAKRFAFKVMLFVLALMNCSQIMAESGREQALTEYRKILEKESVVINGKNIYGKR